MQQQPFVHVGILSAGEIEFLLNGRFESKGQQTSGRRKVVCKNRQLYLEGAEGAEKEFFFEPQDFFASDFELFDVTIGLNFHWERKERQRFRGSLKLMVEEDKVTAINVVPLEEYLCSVISSEMSAEASLELLKAHAVISRSWLLAQVLKPVQQKSVQENTANIYESETEYLRWYDREDHFHFHVCADDHCQRYQGITRVLNEKVVQAVAETEGLVLTYQGEICDARFSKCCGGVAELFENCWEAVSHPYLTAVVDYSEKPVGFTLYLQREEAAAKWLKGWPDAFCNTTDEKILQQVLNDYDREWKDFFRWKVEYTQQELAELIRWRSGFDFGAIIDLVPVERGTSGRLVRLKIVGSKKTIIVGKELEIRRWLSKSHLYSSAFVVEKDDVKNGVPGRFILHGGGWGHGVGLCQIGAAVMGHRGYDYRAILSHYFKNTRLTKWY